MLPASRKGMLYLTHSYMMPLLRTPLFHGRDECRRADAAVLMARKWCSWPSSVGHAVFLRDAQARAEQSLLDVMRRQGVAGEQHIDEAAANQPADVIAAAGVNDGGAEYGEDFPPASFVRRMAAAISRTVTPLGFSLETGLVMNSKRFCRASASRGEDAQTVPADHDRDRRRAPRSSAYIAPAAALRIDEDAAVHFLIFHLHPFAVEPNLGAVVGRAIKTLWESAFDVGRSDYAIRRLDGDGAVVVDGVEDFAEFLGRRSADFDASVAGVVLALTDANVLDGEGAAAREDFVENLGQQQRVDDVPADFDFLNEGGGGRMSRRHGTVSGEGAIIRPIGLVGLIEALLRQVEAEVSLCSQSFCAELKEARRGAHAAARSQSIDESEAPRGRFSWTKVEDS